MEQRKLAGIERVIEWLPRTGQPIAIRIVGATGIMGLAFLISTGLAVFLKEPGLSVPLFGVFACAVIFNQGTGFYAGALAIISETYTFRLAEFGRPSLAGAIIFALVCAAVALFGEALRNALERAVTAERTTGILFRELQHRIQNTLSIIVGLLELQARSSVSLEAKEALKSAANRVSIQSEAHRHLDLKQADRVDAGDYLKEICRLLEKTLHGARPVRIQCEAQQTLVDPPKVLAIGLITNELVTNAVKYAFGEADVGTIAVKLDRDEQGLVRLRVADDGAGCPETVTEGVGTRLIAALVKEHKGTYARINRDKGCEVTVSFAAKPSRG